MVEIVVVGEARDTAELHPAEGPLLADIGVAGGAGDAVAKNSDARKPVIGAIHEPGARRAVGQLGFRRVLVQAVSLQGKVPRRLGRAGTQGKHDQTRRQGDFSHGSSVTSHGGLGSSKRPDADDQDRLDARFSLGDVAAMSTVQEIKSAIEQLPLEERAALVAEFLRLDRQ